ncbi:hypothetical protein DdX_13461 [Ditylenchus destructor]|uniref:Uncharacterized protein n=1 Tax=Ditylenchus destructor TaxID=166010 RepID=A0AAD4MYT3_9BILA|nr:hypothetical protein DdX_13461 [Ditylenchus destructor]
MTLHFNFTPSILNFSKHSAQHCDTSLKSTHPTNVVFKLELSEPTKYYMMHHGVQKLTKYGILQGNGTMAVRVYRKVGEGSNYDVLTARFYHYTDEQLEETSTPRELYNRVQGSALVGGYQACSCNLYAM